MLKKNVTYEDYNGNEATETLYFNLTKTELMDMEEQYNLTKRLEAWSNTGNDEDEKDRKLSKEETSELLSIIKLLIQKSFGVRSEDGKRFMKSDEILLEFTQSAVYDAMVFSMFENPQNAVDFMTGILPKSLMQDAMAEVKAKTVELPETASNENEMTATEMEVPAYVRENRDPTQAEVRKMSQEELALAFQRRIQNQQ